MARGAWSELATACALALAAALALVPACTEDDKPTTADPPGGEGVLLCDPTGELAPPCPADQVCQLGIFCANPCEEGPRPGQCNPPEFRRDPATGACVFDDGTCDDVSDCPEGEVCLFDQGESAGRCIDGNLCDLDDECAESIYGPWCHPGEGRCVGCLENEHCDVAPRDGCNVVTFNCEVPLPPVECGVGDYACCPNGILCERVCDFLQEPIRCVEGRVASRTTTAIRGGIASSRTPRHKPAGSADPAAPVLDSANLPTPAETTAGVG